MKIRKIGNILFPLAAAMLAGLPFSAPGSLSFVQSTYQPGATSSPQPNCVAVSDVNGDGKPDLISCNANENFVTVLTNNGAGIFGSNASLSLPADTYPQFVVAADLKLNGNGKPDIICANNSSDGTMTIWTNNGIGKFGFNSRTPIGQNPYCIAVADINSDGRPALIAANNLGSGTLTVLTNNGQGSFVGSSTNEVGNQPLFVVAADLKINHYGKPDLICANSSDGTLTVLTNNNQSGFGIYTNITVGSGSYSFPYCVAVADVNGDGYPDLISANEADGTLTILTNSGNGHFIFSDEILVGDTISIGDNSSQPVYVAAADLRGKGKPDLICANFQDNTLSVVTNTGSGSFELSTNLTVGISPSWVAVADLNNDGKLDLVSANYNDSTLSVLLQFGTPTLKLSLTSISGTNHLALSWSSILTNFSIQTTTNLSNPNWQSGGYPITIANVTNMSTTITSPPPGSLYFRLVAP
jgi:hypothetical protein